MRYSSLFVACLSLCFATSAQAITLGRPAREHQRGATDPKIILIEYSDFECPFCQRHDLTMQEILKKYPNDVAVAYRHVPLSFHPNALKYAQASECIADQDEKFFWKFHDRLFESLRKQQRVTKRTLIQLAKKSGTNAEQLQKFTKCIASKKHLTEIQEYAAASGVNGTPATYLLPVGGLGEVIMGAQPLESFIEKIDAALAAQKP